MGTSIIGLLSATDTPRYAALVAAQSKRKVDAFFELQYKAWERYLADMFKSQPPVGAGLVTVLTKFKPIQEAVSVF